MSEVEIKIGYDTEQGTFRVYSKYTNSNDESFFQSGYGDTLKEAIEDFDSSN